MRHDERRTSPSTPDRSGAVVTMSSFRCPACERGVCDVMQPVMVVGGGRLRPATHSEAKSQEKRELFVWELTQLPGRGKEGLASYLAEGQTTGASTAEGVLISCSCGHLFADIPPDS